MPARNIGKPYRDQQTVAWEGPTRKFSNSELQTWKDCHRKWYLAYYRGLGLKSTNAEVTGPRSLGTRMHATLEHYYTEDTSAVLFLKSLYEDTEKQLIAQERPQELEGLWKEYDLANAMLVGYIEWIEENAIDEGLRVVAAEDVVEAQMPFKNIVLRGKLDQRIVRESDGARLFRDFKTVGNLTTPTKILHLDEQMKTYHLLEYLEALDKTSKEPQWRTDGALYTMLRKVKRTASAKPPFYGQLEVRHNLEEIRSMWRRVVAEIQEIIEATIALDEGAEHQRVAYPRPTPDCAWKCDFFPICSFFDDGGNAEGMVEAYYEVRDPDARYNTADKEGTES